MTKTEKKIERAIIKALNKVCDIAQNEIAGFEWLTHFLSFNDFPESISIVCIFDSNANCEIAIDDGKSKILCYLIEKEFLDINIVLKDVASIISFDTEENCKIENNGKWNERFR